MYKPTLLITSLLIIFVSCDMFNTGPQYHSGLWASVGSVRVLSINDSIVQFECEMGIPNPCCEFDDAEIIRNENDVHIRFFSKQRMYQNCIQMVSSMVVNLEVELPRGNKYNIHFWRISGDPLNVTIDIPDIQ